MSEGIRLWWKKVFWTFTGCFAKLNDIVKHPVNVQKNLIHYPSDNFDFKPFSGWHDFTFSDDKQKYIFSSKISLVCHWKGNGLGFTKKQLLDIWSDRDVF